LSIVNAWLGLHDHVLAHAVALLRISGIVAMFSDRYYAGHPM
jgi:hypothetical protein